MDEVEIFFCQFPNPWALRVSGMGGYTSKCEIKSKSLHPNVGGTDSLEIFALLESLKIWALENYVCLLRHTFAVS